MKYYHVIRQQTQRARETVRLVAVDGDRAFDLTSADRDLGSFTDLARVAAVSDTSLDRLASRHLDDAERVPVERLDDALAAPIVADEVWGAGVTYEISEAAREHETTLPAVYADVYEADRPELFFKATPSRTVGPSDAVGIRGDSDWNVPEPELGIVLYDGEIVGYTVGNDASSRDIEGANPLYLPQAKVYDRCCAIGPCVSSVDTVGDPHDLELSMTIDRQGETLYDDSTTTANMVRTVDELVSCHVSHDAVPRTSVILTGTALVPDDEFTLQEGDVLRMHVEQIGTLENTVTVV